MKSNVVQRYPSWPVFGMLDAQLQAPNSLRGDVCTTFKLQPNGKTTLLIIENEGKYLPCRLQ
jgi:hypothetical protein